jgi:hypothetical protein
MEFVGFDQVPARLTVQLGLLLGDTRKEEDGAMPVPVHPQEREVLNYEKGACRKVRSSEEITG